MPIPKGLAEATVKQQDAKILRECLAGLYHKAPILIQQKIHIALLSYAKAVSKYCECHDRSWVEKENKFACLDCGTRYRKQEGKDVLEVAK